VIIKFLYNLLAYFALPFVFLRLLWRSRKDKRYRQNLSQRLGFGAIPLESKNAILVHAVSVGETIAAIPLVKVLQQKYPTIPIIVTNTTITGLEQAKKSFQDSVLHRYLPYDFLGSVKRFLRKAQPKLIIIMETELWPNFLAQAKYKNIPVVLANARLSERSFARYNLLPRFTQTLLSNINMICAQADEDQARFIKLGVNENNIVVTGSFKFDNPLESGVIKRGELLRQELGVDRVVWIAASTHDGEDAIVLKALKKVKAQVPAVLLVLVPRHPQRFSDVGKLCEKFKLNVAYRSKNNSCADSTDVYLGDTMGELMTFYAASDLAFVGGSLVQTGGHNLLEPAMFGLPIISGPHLFNFAKVYALLNDARALKIVKDDDALASAVMKILTDTSLAQAMGDAAKSVVAKNIGAVQRCLPVIDRLCRL
jgi:3-deoxy-D-manno-octulosonic-acid transferase